MKHPKVPDSMEYADICNGCGLCCIIKTAEQNANLVFSFADVLPNQEDCQYLQRLENGLTLCRIHGKHTGTVIKRAGLATWHCAEIMDIPHLYEECPYNELKVNK